MAIRESDGHDQPRIDWVAEEKRRSKGHVVVLPCLGQGHINPMMHLSNHLAAHGVLVTFVNSQFNHHRILQSRRACLIQTRKFPDFIHKGSIRLVGMPDGLGYDELVGNFDVQKQAQAIIDMEPFLVKLVNELQPPVTCIIGDVFFISSPAVARRLGIPHVTFWTQSAASYAYHDFVTQNHASLKDYSEKLRRQGRLDERVISFVPSCPTLSYKELPPFLQPCDPSDFLFSCLITNFQTSAADNTFILMNTFEDLELDTLAFIRMRNMLCIGPVLPSQFILNESISFEPNRNTMMTGSSLRVEDAEGCLPWLHHQKPSSVLYVSFGSIARLSAQQVHEFVCGLEASGCPFLMVVRSEMTVGGDSIAFPNGFVDKMRDQGRAFFVAWAPQLEVLAHPALGAFLTHAGWNSTIESICRGVPMLCWPHSADQMLNTRCIVDTWKIGLDFVTENVIDTKGQPHSSGGGESDDTNSNRSSSNKDSNSDLRPLVKHEEIEKKIRQLMDPSTSGEIRKQINSLSLAAKKAYESSSSSSFKSLLDVISC